MRLPGFAAEASLCGTTQDYWTKGLLRQFDGTVRPAIQDPECLLDCAVKCQSSLRPQACYNHCAHRCPILVPELPGF
jgi:hypothetical protein